MAGKKTFYVTTPIYYTNAPPHIGGAYTTIAADILARWNRLNGKEVFFLTGTDEHGQKIQETAEKVGKKPKEFVDEIVKQFKETFKLINVTNDNFIRTTNPFHEKEVQEILQELYKKKYIYKGFYESKYCVGCEQYKTDSELIDGKCPLHNTEPELRKEEAYLFKLSAFQKKLLNLIKTNKFEIVPEDRKKELVSFIEEGLRDISISRLKEKTYWGIELPFDKKHTTFVWVDAFWNYITGIKEKKVFKKFWPADVQLMAKDIARVHATIWPALLLATGNKLPKKMFIHGYFTVNGQKMSKSLGNAISPNYLCEKYGADSIRYFLFRNIPFGGDGDFSELALVERHNNELANKLGNLVSRVSTLAETYGLQKTKPLDSKKLFKKVSIHLEKYEFDRALNEIFAFVDSLNELVQAKKPWETKDKKVLYQLANGIKDVAILLSPFIPQTCENIAKTFKFDISLKSLKTPLKVSKISKSEILFKKIEVEPLKISATLHQPKILITNNAPKEKVNKIPSIEGIATMTDIIKYDDFAKLDLRVGKILKAEDIDGADKLLKLEVDIGKEKRTILAGIKKFYKKEELVGKNIVVIVNLEPRKMKGLESQGMLLAAASEDETSVILLQPEKNIAPGSKIR